MYVKCSEYCCDRNTLEKVCTSDDESLVRSVSCVNLLKVVVSFSQVSVRQEKSY